MSTSVSTPIGELIVEINQDSTYPAIWISTENGAPVATIEYTPNRNEDGSAGIQVLAWRDVNDEEPSEYVNVDGFENW